MRITRLWMLASQAAIAEEICASEPGLLSACIEMTHRVVAVLAAGDVPAHVDPGDVAVVQLDQRVRVDRIDDDRACPAA